MTDTFANYSRGLSSPARNATLVTPSDSNDLTFFARAIYVGGAGNVSIVTPNGQTVTFENVSGVIPVEVARVRSTNTTATNIIALW